MRADERAPLRRAAIPAIRRRCLRCCRHGDAASASRHAALRRFCYFSCHAAIFIRQMIRMPRAAAIDAAAGCASQLFMIYAASFIAFCRHDIFIYCHLFIYELLFTRHLLIVCRHCQVSDAPLRLSFMPRHFPIYLMPTLFSALRHLRQPFVMDMMLIEPPYDAELRQPEESASRLACLRMFLACLPPAPPLS